MKKMILMTVAIINCVVFPQSFTSGGLASPNNSFKAFKNPSLLAYEPSGSILYYNSVEGDEITGHGMLLGINRFNFGYYKQDEVESYILSSGTEVAKGFYAGSSARWFSGANIKPEYDLSFTLRPSSYFSAACNLRNILRSNDENVVYETGIAYRPFGSSFIDIHAGLEFTADDIKKPMVSAGFSTDIIRGIDIFAGYSSDLKHSNTDPIYKLGISLTMGNLTGGTGGTFEGKTGRFVNYAAISSINPPSVLPPRRNRMVKIELEGQYREESQHGFLSRIPFIGGRGKTARDLIASVNRLADDRSVAGIVIVNRGYSMSFTQREEFRTALENFKAKNKKIYSYFITASQSDYYIMSMSDRIYMYPEGSLELQGLGIELMFLKGILDKAGIKMQTVRHGTYKSAVEMFSMEEASPENIEQLERVLSMLDTVLKKALSEGRKISVGKLNEIMNSIPYHTGRSALEHGLVDGLVYENDLNKTVEDEYGSSNVRFISLKDHFSNRIRSSVWESATDKKIAIVYATGNIVTGKSSGGGLLPSDNMGSETTAAMIRRARKDRNTKAIVLRVDSGGGSALASDIILTELRLAQTENELPVIVSMGSTAASGGYWISCYADKIFASKTTVTGSIGVFAMMPSFEELAGRLGVKTRRIVLNDFAARSVFKDLNGHERDFLQKMIDEFYKDFVDKVAQARNSSFDEIDKVAQGRIWTGEDALDAGLIDKIGGLEDAVKYAVELTGIDTRSKNYLKVFTKHSEFSMGEMLMGALSDDLKLISQELAGSAEIINMMTGGDFFLKLMPFRIEIK